MADDCANGSTFTWAGTAVGEIRSLDFNEDGNAVDVTVLGSSTHVYCGGIPDEELTVEIIGSESDNSITVNSTGSIAVAWNDGGSESIGTALCTSRQSSGDLDGEITTTYTFKPSAA